MNKQLSEETEFTSICMGEKLECTTVAAIKAIDLDYGAWPKIVNSLLQGHCGGGHNTRWN